MKGSIRLNLTYKFLEERLPANGTGHVAIFDIDSTIMDTGPRNLAILREAGEAFPQIADAVAKVTSGEIGWSITHALDVYMDVTDELRAQLQEFWKVRFFSDHYVGMDEPYSGALECIRWVAARGMTIVFLTGRDEPNMAKGTRASFLRHGFDPEHIGSTGRFYFFFKPDPAESDLTYKKRAVMEIAELGTVSLVVENEPANANILARAFPSAAVFLIDTVTSPDPGQLDDGIVVFSSFPEADGRL